MSDVNALRESLARVDRLRAEAAAADSARVTIRLSGQPIARRGLLGFMKRGDWPDQIFTRGETNAIYDALAVVRNDAQSRADELEKTIAGEDL